MTLGGLAGATAATALAAYLDAKYFLRKDIRGLLIAQQSAWRVAQRAKENTMSVWYSFEAAVKSAAPYQEALWSRDGSYTFAETHSYACRYAQLLIGLGVAPRDAVCCFLSNSPDMIFAWLGSMAAGAYPALINYNLSGDGLIHCLRLSRSKVVFVDSDSDIRRRIEDVRGRVEMELGMTIIVVDDAFRTRIRQMSTARPDDSLRTCLNGADTCFLIFTSGTTGFPKAVPFSYHRLVSFTVRRLPGVGNPRGPEGRMYNCMPMYHGTGGCLALLCMMEGQALCIGKRFRVSTFWDDVRDSRAREFVYVGETLRYLLAAPPSPQDKSHHVRIIFGNGLRPDVWKQFRDRFGIDTVAEFFASTEGVFDLLNIARGDFRATAVGHHGLIARAMFSPYLAFARTSDENTKDLWRSKEPPYLCQRMPAHVGGEVVVKIQGTSPADSGFAGYKDNPKATGDRFERDVFEKGDLYYRTGDALRRDGDGRWFFLDRLGDTFRWKSENVSTAEVAEAVGTFPGVLEANVYGVLVPGHDGRAGCAAVYIPGSTGAIDKFDWKGLVDHSKKRLPKYAVPMFIRVMNGEIKASTHNMKQNKVVLRNEGCEVDKISSQGDRMLFLPPGRGEYVEFQPDHWDDLKGGSLKL